MNNFILFLIGPSGIGKTTIRKWLIAKNQNFKYPVSLTTRNIRENEIEGVDYRFISNDHFENLISLNRLVEWEEHFDNYYGIEEDFFIDSLEKKYSLVKEIAFDGYSQFLKNTKIERSKIISIFLYPKNIDFLLSRLKQRGDKDIEQRTKSINEELKHYQECDRIFYIDENNSDSIRNDIEEFITDLLNR